MTKRSLFSSSWLHDEINVRKERMVGQIRQNRSKEIMSGDLESLASEEAARSMPTTLKLLAEQMTISDPYDVDGETGWTVYIPFEGDHWIFGLRPDQHNMNPPYADIERNEILIEIIIDTTRPTEKTIDGEAKKKLDELEWWVSSINAQIAKSTEDLKQVALREFSIRRDRLRQDEELANASKLPRRTKK